MNGNNLAAQVSSDAFLSILSPRELGEQEYRQLSEAAFHDLGLDQICSVLTNKPDEQNMIRRVMCRIVRDPETVQYRCDVFDDLMHYPAMRNRMMQLLNRVHYLQDYVRSKRDLDKKDGAWDLLHRLGEIYDYIQCVEEMYGCLTDTAITSGGLIRLREILASICSDSAFAELKKDITSLRVTTGNLKSATIGINLNDRFEADGIGLISINDRPFSQSGILSGFLSKLASREAVQQGNDWDGSYTWHPVNAEDISLASGLEKVSVLATSGLNPLMGAGLGLSRMQQNEQGNEIMHYMDRIADQILGSVVKELKNVLGKYATVSIYKITGLVPEFVYYIRWAEYMERLQEKGIPLCKAVIAEKPVSERRMHAEGFYNLKLAAAALRDEQPVIIDPEEGTCGEQDRMIVTNDLTFDPEHRVFILTGANRGGKTTITQAVGQLFVLAQGGIYVPAQSFSFHPADNIFTHFPADEDRTMDYGRLGEECSRFRELYRAATGDSLLLLNETFSTTSFEEGYYIARDAARAILKKGIRTIYNTHMHKLALEMEAIDDGTGTDRAASLVMRSEEGKRSYKVAAAPPEGMSYAKDIAEKYGVTYEMLIQ